MGFIQHHAIIVTSWNREQLQRAHDRACEIGCAVTSIAASPVNGYASFLVAPDGSKEGWDESVEGDHQRDDLTDWLEDQKLADGSSYLEWVEVCYGKDDSSAKVERNNMKRAASRSAQ